MKNSKILVNSSRWRKSDRVNVERFGYILLLLKMNYGENWWNKRERQSKLTKTLPGFAVCFNLKLRYSDIQWIEIPII